MPWQTRTVIWTPPAEAALRRLVARDPRLVERVLAATDRYATTGYGDVRRRQGLPQYRLRVGNWRIVFDLAPQQVIVLRLADRREAYRGS